MVQKSILERIRNSLETTDTGLEEKVRSQYVHECGHLGGGEASGLITGDGIAAADQILRQTMVLGGWGNMDATARCETISEFSIWLRTVRLVYKVSLTRDHLSKDAADSHVRWVSCFSGSQRTIL